MTRWAESTAGPPWSAEPDDEDDALLEALLTSARGVAGAARAEDALSQITAGAVAAVPGIRDAGIALRGRDGMLSCKASTTQTAARIDRAQLQLAEGPCIDAVCGARTVILPNAATETRWPRFVPWAVRQGLRASMSVRFMSTWPVGTLNLHITGYALDESPRRMQTRWSAQMFVAYASLALAGADRVEGLEKALDRRDVIGQAKGIIMHRYDVDADEAFDRLRCASQTTNTKLYDIAVWLVACRTP